MIVVKKRCRSFVQLNLGRIKNIKGGLKSRNFVPFRLRKIRRRLNILLLVRRVSKGILCRLLLKAKGKRTYRPYCSGRVMTAKIADPGRDFRKIGLTIYSIIKQ